MGGGRGGLLFQENTQVSQCVSFAGSKWMLRAPLMEICGCFFYLFFFAFRLVFMKDSLKEKSDVSFMASPSGLKAEECNFYKKSFFLMYLLKLSPCWDSIM